jgi:hypothetical protein
VRRGGKEWRLKCTFESKRRKVDGEVGPVRSEEK